MTGSGAFWGALGSMPKRGATNTKAKVAPNTSLPPHQRPNSNEATVPPGTAPEPLPFLRHLLDAITTKGDYDGTLHLGSRNVGSPHRAAADRRPGGCRTPQGSDGAKCSGCSWNFSMRCCSTTRPVGAFRFRDLEPSAHGSRATEVSESSSALNNLKTFQGEILNAENIGLSPAEFKPI